MDEKAEIERLKAALRKSEDRVAALLNTVVEAIIVINAHGTVATFNTAAERIFGYAAAEVVGRNVSMLMPEPHRSRHDQYVANYLETGESRIIGIGRELTGQRKDGTTFPIFLSVGELDHWEERFFIGSIRDLSERKAIEAQLLQASKMEAIGRLSGGIAHDFNNQLAVLQMDLELLAEMEPLPAAMAELIAESSEVVEAAADLTRRLLAVSRRQPLAPSVVDVAALVEQMTGLLRRTLGEHVRIDTSSPSDLWRTRVDRAQLENVLLNLAVNARDAMPKGGRLAIEASNLTVAGRPVSAGSVRPGEYVLLNVRDTGTGMTPEVIEHAFEPFFTTKEAGTGLGLSMVYGFVGQSGGHVEIASKPDAGTTVSIYLPRFRTDGTAERRAGRTAVPRGGNETILLVEDHARLRERTASRLRALGYRVAVCADAAEAVRRIEAGEHVDLLFTDVVMPGGLDGAALVERARRSRPDIGVLFMTGYADQPDTVAALVATGAGMLRKPFSRDRLALAVRHALDHTSDS